MSWTAPTPDEWDDLAFDPEDFRHPAHVEALLDTTDDRRDDR